MPQSLPEMRHPNSAQLTAARICAIALVANRGPYARCLTTDTRVRYPGKTAVGRFGCSPTEPSYRNGEPLRMSSVTGSGIDLISKHSPARHRRLPRSSHSMSNVRLHCRGTTQSGKKSLAIWPQPAKKRSTGLATPRRRPDSSPTPASRRLRLHFPSRSAPALPNSMESRTKRTRTHAQPQAPAPWLRWQTEVLVPTSRGRVI